jgi:hypothetical protein
MGSKADTARRLWNVLVVAVAVWIVAGIIFLVTDSNGGIFDATNPSGWETALIDAQFIAFRLGSGALALMAGLWLSTRPFSQD